jgi:hypothetical protein
MNTEPEKKIKEIEEKRKNEKTNETKELVKKMNVDAVANILIKMQNENYALRSEFVDLKRMISKVTQDKAELQAQLNILKAMGGRGIIGGTGSTVHTQGK